MPANLSDTLESALLNWMKGTSFPAAPSGGSTYISLHTSDPGETDAGVAGEVSTSGTGYARLHVVAADWGTPAGNPLQMVNASQFVWPTAILNWATITHAAIWRDASGSSVKYWVGQLSQPIPVPAGTQFNIAPGNFILQAG